jgi:hypothetical protein
LIKASAVISGLLTPIGQTSRDALISKEPTKFVAKIYVNSRSNRFYQNKWNDNPEKGIIDILYIIRDLKLKNSERFAQIQFY